MFQLIPVPERKRHQPLRVPLSFLGQFLLVAFVILIFVLYVSGPLI